jgi:hypothetical protein
VCLSAVTTNPSACAAVRCLLTSLARRCCLPSPIRPITRLAVAACSGPHSPSRLDFPVLCYPTLPAHDLRRSYMVARTPAIRPRRSVPNPLRSLSLAPSCQSASAGARSGSPESSPFRLVLSHPRRAAGRPCAPCQRRRTYDP